MKSRSNRQRGSDDFRVDVFDNVMAEHLVDLKLDRSLIDPQFDGYKLSLDPLPVYKLNLDEGLDVAKLTEDQHSFQHIRAFGLTNHIVVDQWDQNSVYVVYETWNVVKITVNLETSLDKGTPVFQIPDCVNQKLVPGRHNVSLCFVSHDWAVLGDGAGKLHLLKTGLRTESSGKLWTVSHTCEPLELGRSFVVHHGILRADNETLRIECLLVHVEELIGESKDEHSSPFETILEWVTFVSADRRQWEVERTRRLVSTRCPEYASIDLKGQALFLCSEKPFRMVYDSVNPVAPPTVEAEEKEEDHPPAYTWNQTMEEVSVEFTVGQTVTKADIYLSLHSQQIEFGVKNNRVLLQGALPGTVDIEGSTWTIDGQRLSLTLTKSEGKMWQTVVLGDSRGELIMDPEQMAAIHERLAHLTSSEWNPDPEKVDNKPFNSQELEECDTFTEESAVLQRIDGESHEITHQVNISSHQWLFNVHLDADNLPALCLRHDVDGVVWQPETSVSAGDVPWKHVSTFNALGYVQASKQQKKYCVSAPDSSYCVVCDCVRHLYIYRQLSAVSSPLRNRKTGRQVSAVAKQQVVALESVDDIMGVYATNERLYILAGKTFHVVKVN